MPVEPEPFSVLLPVYRGDDAGFFERAITSVTRDQELRPDELVVVVDGPVPDPIAEVLRRAEAGHLTAGVPVVEINPEVTPITRVATESWRTTAAVGLPALVAGVALSFTRSLGEFGAVIFIAGNIAWKTEVTSLMIFIRLQEFDYPAASAIASVILAASLLLLYSINTLQSRFGRRVVGH